MSTEVLTPVAWVVAMIGWGISNHHANIREKRKEFRSEIDAIEKVSKSVVEKLSVYLKLAERNADAFGLELEIKVLLKEIDLKWERLSKRKFKKDAQQHYRYSKNYLENFFDAATSKYFETPVRLPPSEYSNHMQLVHTKALLFVEGLHRLFLKQFDDI